MCIICNIHIFHYYHPYHTFMKRFLLIFLGLLAMVKPIKASVTMVWASQLDLVAVQSDGITNVNEQFLVHVGVFAPSFTPTAANRAQWVENWVSFGSTPFDTVDNQFNASTTLTDNSLAPQGSQIYIWVTNNNPVPEWFIATNDSMDGNSADDWVVPDISTTNQTTGSMQFDLNEFTLPLVTVLYGKTEQQTGGGDFTGTPTNFGIQTHIIPEPSTTLGLFAALLLTFRRRR